MTPPPRPPPRLLPQQLNYHNPATEREIARRWRRHRIRFALQRFGNGIVYGAALLIIMTIIMAWRLKFRLLFTLFHGQ